GDVLAAERADGRRVVVDSDHWTAYVPAAARWPVEVHLVPHRQVPDIVALTDSERDDFARVYLDVLRRLDRLYDKPLPYIAAWHQAPVRVGRDLSWLQDRKSTRLNSSHVKISYAVFCLKKKKQNNIRNINK